MLRFQNVAYAHPDRHVQFSDINFTLQPHETVAITGNNGSGKSTLLRLAAGELAPSRGEVKTGAPPYFLPQIVGQFDNLTVAHALRVHKKVAALTEILAGHVSEKNLALLDDDWTIEEKCIEALAYWQLQDIPLHCKLSSLSGGQKTRAFLAGLHVHQPQLILLDEPTNHLDSAGRELLYRFVNEAKATMAVVTHDRQLLHIPGTIYELAEGKLSRYGGNYDFFISEKQLQENALIHDLQETGKALRKAREAEREMLERQQRHNARGKKKQEKAGVPKIMMNTLRNLAENSAARAKSTHAEKISGIAATLTDLRSEMATNDRMRLNFDNSSLHRGKVLFAAKAMNFRFADRWIWPNPLEVTIASGDRLALIGQNGSGKSTLIRLILGQLQPGAGEMSKNIANAVYIDQDYSLLNDELSVTEQAALFNTRALPEAEINSRLTHFLFTADMWNKPCSALSGGERMRLTLCCIAISGSEPDLLVLDEPTNNLDLKNVEILTNAVKHYKGTLVVVSHDKQFLEDIGITSFLELTGAT
ncbi:MAG: ABC-F family ATP-binding cassette domain-containing protein [Taibaiella sp.]|nr:ABC-F family ATP-binding cassette domain-containing protein [Taibaiella sp.]